MKKGMRLLSSLKNQETIKEWTVLEWSGIGQGEVCNERGFVNWALPIGIVRGQRT